MWFESLNNIPQRGPRANCCVLVELVEVEADEELFKLTFLGQVADDLVQEARIVAELLRDILKVCLSPIVAADAHTIVTHDEVEFDYELEDLIYRHLESIIASSTQEALLQDIVQIAIV